MHRPINLRLFPGLNLVLQINLDSSDSPAKILYPFLTSTLRATRPVFITLTLILSGDW
jgi:hypothetical protein